MQRRFWLLGRRVDELWRPWVGEQITRPGYLTKRVVAGFVLQVPLIVLPQLLLALVDGQRWRWLFPVLFLVALAVGVSLSRRNQGRQLIRILAYHGVTADGQLVDPASAWQVWGYPSKVFTPTVVTLLVAQFVVVTSGVAVAVDHYTSPNRCRPASAAVVETGARAGRDHSRRCRRRVAPPVH